MIVIVIVIVIMIVIMMLTTSGQIRYNNVKAFMEKRGNEQKESGPINKINGPN